MKPFYIKAHVTDESGRILRSWEDQFPLLIECPLQQECAIVALAYAVIMQARLSASNRFSSLGAITATSRPLVPRGQSSTF